MLGNIKNWSWDVYPQFKIEKEDAEALRDLDALQEYIDAIKTMKRSDRT